jgi:hypothetical protein
MATLLYILYLNNVVYKTMPDVNIFQERTFFENAGNGGIMKMMVFLDVCIWIIGFISLGFWYWKIF